MHAKTLGLPVQPGLLQDQPLPHLHLHAEAQGRMSQDLPLVHYLIHLFQSQQYPVDDL